MRWADVKGFEDIYEVSEFDEVFYKGTPRTRSDGVVRIFPRRRLAQHQNEKGYLTVSLCVGMRSKKYKIHRLVLMAFNHIDGCEDLDVNHKDGVKSNNDLNNLEWMTRSENLKHRYRNLGQPHAMNGKFGEKHHRSRPIVALKNGSVASKYNSLMCAQRDGFSAGHISSCLAGKRKSHKGLQWAAL